MDNQLANTLQYLIQSIVADPSDITIDTKEDNGFTTLEISAPAEKVGQIIGKEGKIIKSLRALLSLAYPSLRFAVDIKN